MLVLLLSLGKDVRCSRSHSKASGKECIETGQCYIDPRMKKGRNLSHSNLQEYDILSATCRLMCQIHL